MAVQATAMAPAAPVLFAAQQGQILDPTKPSQLLQGFLGVMGAEGSSNGTLTQAQLTDYEQKRFFAADPNSNVAGYMANNFAAIAGLDGNAQSISADDLVQLKQGLPTPQPPVQQPPYGGDAGGGQMMQVFFQMMQMMMQMMMSLFGQGQ